MLSTDVMIEVDELTKDYGPVRALDRVSFQVSRGEVVGFLGPNGAGKSTTMRILTCFISATSGAARIHGHDVFDASLEVRRRLGYLPQRAALYGEMSVWEYLRFVAKMRGLGRAAFEQRLRAVAEVCGIAGSLGRDIRTLSHGYRQRVGLAQALLHDPPILILDEPTSDLDPNERAEVLRYVREIGKHRTILLSTHNLSEVEAACDRVVIVSKGKVVADGALDQVRADSDQVRYFVTVREPPTGSKGPAAALPAGRPSDSDDRRNAEELRRALAQLPGVSSVKHVRTDDGAHRLELLGAGGRDLGPEISTLVVHDGWHLVELRREARTLEQVFKQLTTEPRRRGREASDVDEIEDDADGDPSGADPTPQKE